MLRLLALLLLLWPALAGAATLAVLPLGKGAGSATYDGLGDALAGMITADLARVPSLSLVERARLEAVLAELRLSETGFVDPATAQRTGRGVGAAFLVTGTWSVVDQTFVIDVRVVDTETGAIAKAAVATGTIGDFVAVEKEVVEALLEGLEISLSTAERRRLLLEAPTERFEAFSAFSEGQHHERAQALEAARRAYEAAVAADPEFAAAQAALGRLSALVEAERARDRAALGDAMSAVHARVYAMFPDERGRPATARHDTDSTAGVAIRLMALENEQRWCDRYAEMVAYLDHVDWRVTAPPRDERGAFSTIVNRQASEAGFGPAPVGWVGPENARRSPGDRARVLWTNTATFVVHEDAVRPYSPGDGVIGALRRCFAPEAQLVELDRLLAAARRHGVADQGEDHNPKSPYTLEESLLLTWAWVRATHLGADAGLERRTREVLARHPDEADPARLHLLGRLEQIAQQARMWEQSRAVRVGMPEAELVRLAQAAAAGDAAPFDARSPLCAALIEAEKPGLERWALWDRWAASDRGQLLDQTARWAAPMRAAGCVRGAPALFPDFDALAGALASASVSPDGSCGALGAGLALQLTPAALGSARSTPAAELAVSRSLLATWYALVSARCLPVPE